MIERETIDKIFDTVDVVDVIGDFIHLKKRGVNYLGNCPFHNEKTPSFTVSPSKGIYKCFGCGKGGNSVNFIMEHEKLSYVDALKFLAKKYHIEVVEKELTPEEKEKKDARESLMIVSEFAAKTFQDNLLNSEEGKAVGLKYFKERGFNDKIIEKFDLGYCRASRDSFTKLAEEKGYQTKYLVDTGLTIKRDDGSTFDRFSERVMFPIHNLMGRVIGFGGRTLRTDKKIAKYLNSPASVIYDKSKVLYGLYLAKNAIVKFDNCFLVEGYTDVMSMHQSGIENVVASSGTSLTTEQIRLIQRFTQNITVLFDGDAAGIKAALRGIDMVLKEGMHVKVALLPDGEDPDSFAQKHSASEFEAFIEQNKTDFIKFKTNLLLADAQGDPLKKAELVKDIVKSIAVIPDTITRSMYAQECASMMSMDEQLLLDEISKIIYGAQKKQWKQDRHEPPPPLPPEPEEMPPDIAPLDTTKTVGGLKFQDFESELVRLILNYGNRHIFTLEENKVKKKVHVIEYIIHEIEHELEIQNPLYQSIITEYATSFAKDSNLTVRKFVNHENPDVVSVTADLLAHSEKHKLSRLWTMEGAVIKAEEDRLKEIIDNTIGNYKYAIVMDHLLQIETQMQAESSTEKVQELFEKYAMYTKFKREISKSLGERIILKR